MCVTDFTNREISGIIVHLFVLYMVLKFNMLETLIKYNGISKIKFCPQTSHVA